VSHPTECFFVNRPDGTPVCQLFNRQDEDFDRAATRSANAHLIAAAPEMRDALKRAQYTLSEVVRLAPGYDWNADPLKLTLATGETFAEIAAAIAKSEGR
jgi:hypothetical protein